LLGVGVGVADPVADQHRPDSVADPEPDPVADQHRPDSVADPDANSDSHADANSDSHADAYANSHASGDDASRDADADPHSDTDSTRVCNCITDAHCRNGNGDGQGPATDRRGRPGRQQRSNNAPANHRFGRRAGDSGEWRCCSCANWWQEIALEQVALI
jgi:hypothetical protein